MEIDAAIGPKLFLALAFQDGGIIVFDSIIFYRNTPMLASGIKGIRVQLRDLIRSE